jgi:hypothetical protein
VLNNITNFFNLIKTGKVKTQLDASDLLPIGTRDLRFIGQYQPTMIKYSDLVAGLVGGTNGQVLFRDNNTFGGSNNLFWDKVNNRLGIGTTIPANTLDVNGTVKVLTSIEVNGKRLSGGASALTSNTAYGANTLTVASVNGDNTAIGYIALQNNTGTMNTSVGSYSLTQNSTGQLNTAIGGYAGSSVTSGSNNILVGYNSQLGSGGQSNQIVIGVGASGLGSNTTVIGNSSITHGRWWGNLLIGTSIDAGFTLDVNGTARVSGALTVSGNQILFSGSTTNTYITQNIGTGVGNFSAATCVQFQVNTFPKIIVRDTGSSRASTLIVGDNVATTESAHSSALLEVRSSSSYIKGFLPPRMTQTERNSIATPAVGLMVYQTDATEGLYVYKSTGWALNS